MLKISLIGASIGDCTVDTFSVSSPSNMGSPTICGFNDKQHSNFLNEPSPAFFVYFRSFSNINFIEKTVGVSRIRTRIVRLEGEHAVYLTTTTTQ